MNGEMLPDLLFMMVSYLVKVLDSYTCAEYLSQEVSNLYGAINFLRWFIVFVGVCIVILALNFLNWFRRLEREINELGERRT